MLRAVGRRRRASWPTAAVVVAVVVVMSGLAGCGSAASPSPPTGIDGLTIPTPSPRPTDFVAGVDNPWFPLPDGARWTYDVSGPVGPATLAVTAAGGPRVQAVATTAVRSVVRRTGRTISDVTDLYAQDRSGNVWWFGRRVTVSLPGSSRATGWQAGSDGARAGLLMPACPRLGDGFRTVLAPGVADDRAEVVGTRADVRVPAGDYPESLVIDTSDTEAAGTTTRRFYASGVGLVEEQTLLGEPQLSTRLTSFDLP